MYTAEIGKINGKYVARVLKDGVLVWQGKRTYLRSLSATNAAIKKRNRMAEAC